MKGGLSGAIALAALVACNKNQGGTETRTFQPPTATEVFNLRSKCAELGEKLMDANIVGPALHQTNVSHYDPRSNRCYVVLDISNSDLAAPYHHHRVLYDGQTKEMLADSMQANAKLTGHVFMQDWDGFARSLGMDLEGRWKGADDFNGRFVDALIDAAMADERKQ